MREVDNTNSTIKLVKKDFIAMTIITLIYAVIALLNLGSTQVPQSFWQPAKTGEGFYVDLGESKEIEAISCFVGLGDGSYHIRFSEDAVLWQGDTILKENKMYRWGSVKVNEKARYVKITVGNPKGMLHEIGIFGKEENEPLSIVSLTELEVSEKDQGTPHMVFDEQKYVQKNPSYLAGMYFDEVYHARTAYEMLNKLEHYEWTHPPLGKIFISLGVAMFGMNPFGWRIVGTLFGIAMVPCMYLLGKRLFKKTAYAFLTAFLMAFDFMHFTQTRIATVDVYGVFFIILMYYFMYKFTETKPSKEGLKKSIIQLALSGIFFALGAASKWISFYAAVGLAFLFFKEIYVRYVEYKSAVKYLDSETAAENVEEHQRCSRIKDCFAGDTVKTLAWAVVFFIIVPLAVYIMSYIPFMLIPGPGHGFKDILKYQERMFTYHNDLVATHPYQSPWLEWPIMLRPMWYYYAGAYLPSGKLSSIVAMGNPAVWWTGIITFIAMVIVGIKKKDKVALFITVGVISNYLPWALISRITFIYHYFATVPFIILSIVYIAAVLCEKKKRGKYYVYGYAILVVILFIILYPVISGAVVNDGYAWGFLKWF